MAESIAVDSPYGSLVDKILIFSEARCRAVLQSTFGQQDMLSDGLNFLAEQASINSTLPCWSEIVSDPPASPTGIVPELARHYDAKIALAEFAVAVAKRRFTCSLFRNSDFSKQGVSEACIGRTLPSKQESERRLRAAENALKDLKLEASLTDGADGLIFLLDPLSRYETNIPKAKVAALEDALAKMTASLQEAPAGFDRSAALALWKQLSCLNARGDLAEYCERKNLNPKDSREELIKRGKELFGNPEMLASTWLAQSTARERELNESLVPAANEAYAFRRLLAQYYHYQTTAAPLEGSTKKFCAANRAAQLRDLQFAKKFGKLEIFSSPLQWEYVWEGGMSEAQRTAIALYSSKHYRDVNAFLRGKKSAQASENEKNRYFADILDGGLAHARPYRETPVYRLSELPPEDLAKHQEGAIVKYDAFTSTSIKEDWGGLEGNRERRHHFKIYPGARGVRIAPLAASAPEEEVLFRPGTRFKVISRRPRDGQNGVFDFELAEVDADENSPSEEKATAPSGSVRLPAR